MSTDKKQELDELYGYGLKIIQELHQYADEKEQSLEDAESRYDAFIGTLEQALKKAKQK